MATHHTEAGPSTLPAATRRSPPPYAHSNSINPSTAHVAGSSESGHVSDVKAHDRAHADRSIGMDRTGRDGEDARRRDGDAYIEGREQGAYKGGLIGHGQKRDRSDRTSSSRDGGMGMVVGGSAASSSSSSASASRPTPSIATPSPRYAQMPARPSATSSATPSAPSHPSPSSRSNSNGASNSTTTTPSTTSTPYFEASTRSSFSTAFTLTSPVASSSRHWVPTTNVPEHISRRHRKTGGGSRWLSEDEGIGGSGLRRRGSAGAAGSTRPSAGFGPSGAGPGLGSGSAMGQGAERGLGIGTAGREEQGQRQGRRAAPAPFPLDQNAHPSTAHHLTQAQGTDDHAGPSRRYKPPLLKHPSEIRTPHDRSSSGTHNAHAYSQIQASDNGGRRISSPSFPSAPSDLPQIRNLLPRTTVPGLTASGLTSDDPVGTLAMRGGADLPDPPASLASPVSPKDTSGAVGWRAGDEPFSMGTEEEMDEVDELKAHGHGMLGNGHAEKVWWNDQSEGQMKLRPGETERQRSKRELVGKLRRLMACNLCPPGTHKTFHHPLTLPCGHTLSSDHLSIPCPAPLSLPLNTPPHEVYAAEQKQHAQRLSLWAGVMCPIPTCKRYSPYAVNDIGHEPVSPTTAFRSMSAPAMPTGTGRGPPTVMSSGVTYYPSQTPAPPYTPDPPHHEIGSPLLDTAVDKVLGLVLLATGEEGEAYSRTFSVDKGKNSSGDLSKGGEMEVDNASSDEKAGGHSSGPHPASGTFSNIASITPRQQMDERPERPTASSEDDAQPLSPVSSTTRSPSFKRPRNRLGTDSSSSIESTIDTPATGNAAAAASASASYHNTGPGNASIGSETAILGRPDSSDPGSMLGVNDVISPIDQMTQVSIPNAHHGHHAQDASAGHLASGPTSTSASGAASHSGHAASAGVDSATKHSPTGKSSQTSNVSDKDDGTVDLFKAELMGVLECDVCAQLLFEPVTTPCQHSFCSKCLARSLDHSQRCPVCRQNLPSFAFFNEHTINRVLLTVLKTAFPAEYAERAAAIEKDERDARLNTPIFVCTLAFPGMPTILHVFEPRYRLMIRRCIESDTPRFGMVLPSRASRAGQNGGAGGGMFPIMPTNDGAAGPGAPEAGQTANAAAAAEAAVAGGEVGGIGGVMEYGTMLEIQSVQMLPDGRSMVETVGTHRFRLLEKGSLDGYTVGRVERIDDIPPEEEAALEVEAVRAAKAAKDARAAHTRTLFGHRSGSASGSTAASGPEMASVPGIAPASTASGPSGSVGPIPPTGDTSQPPGLPQFPSQAVQPPHASSNSTSGHNPNNLIDDTPHSTVDLMNICRSFIDQLRSGSAPWLLQRLNNTYGSMPTDPSEFSYWMALVMPIDEFEKARLLPIRSPRLRLKLIVHWVESLRSSWWFSSG